VGCTSEAALLKADDHVAPGDGRRLSTMDRPLDYNSSDSSVDTGDELPSAETHYLCEISRSVLLTAEDARHAQRARAGRAVLALWAAWR
jgi:hypothetical protein